MKQHSLNLITLYINIFSTLFWVWPKKCRVNQQQIFVDTSFRVNKKSIFARCNHFWRTIAGDGALKIQQNAILLYIAFDVFNNPNRNNKRLPPPKQFKVRQGFIEESSKYHKIIILSHRGNWWQRRRRRRWRLRRRWWWWLCGWCIRIPFLLSKEAIRQLFTMSSQLWLNCWQSADNTYNHLIRTFLGWDACYQQLNWIVELYRNWWCSKR